MRLGLALFDALDYNKDSNEELLISTELENLIAKITLEEADGSHAFTIDEIDSVSVRFAVCVLVRPILVGQIEWHLLEKLLEKPYTLSVCSVEPHNDSHTHTNQLMNVLSILRRFRFAVQGKRVSVKTKPMNTIRVSAKRW